MKRRPAAVRGNSISETLEQNANDLRLLNDGRGKDGMGKNIRRAGGPKVYERNNLNHENQECGRQYQRDAVGRQMPLAQQCALVVVVLFVGDALDDWKTLMIGAEQARCGQNWNQEQRDETHVTG